MKRSLPSVVIVSTALLVARTAGAQATPAPDPPTTAEPPAALTGVAADAPPPPKAQEATVSVVGDRADRVQKTPGSTFVITAKE